MAERAKRRRLTKSSGELCVPSTPSALPQISSTSATVDDKRNWKGFCEVESEPVSIHPTITQLFGS